MPREKIWSKQLLVTDIKTEEKPISHTVKDTRIIWLINQWKPFLDPSFKSLYIDTDPGPIMDKYNISRSGFHGKQVQTLGTESYVEPWSSVYFLNGKFLYGYEYLNGLMHWSLRTKFPVVLSPRIVFEKCTIVYYKILSYDNSYGSRSFICYDHFQFDRQKAT